MRIEEVRPSFTVYVVASDLGRLDGVIESLGLSGYVVASFSELTAAFSEIHSNPPHIVLFDHEEKTFDLGRALAQVHEQLPETHVFMVAPLAAREKAAAWFERGAYDLILTPLATPGELVKALDRAAERDYFMYMNEQLRSGSAGAGQPTDLPFTRELFATSSPDAATRVFLQAASRLLGASPAIYFKYVQNRRLLVASHGEGITPETWQSVGVDFNSMMSEFRADQLRRPESLTEIASMVKEVFGRDVYLGLSVEVQDEIQGVVLFLCPPPAPDVLETLKGWRGLLEKALTLLELERRLHVVSIQDPATGLLNRQTFLNKIIEEVGRSRRTHLPVSVLMLRLDQQKQIVDEYGEDEGRTIARMVARIFEKHSRVNDIVGRMGPDEFGILLPHTGQRGGMVKAERLRRMIESADFARVLSAYPRLTVSIGISEYPSLAHDAEELLQTADEALIAVRQKGNKCCVATAPDGFVADFAVVEKGL